MLLLESVVAVSAVNPPDRISGVLANAPFDVMQVTRVDASLRHVAFKGGHSSGAVTATGKIPVTTFFLLFREPLKQMESVLLLSSLGNVPDMNAHLGL